MSSNRKTSNLHLKTSQIEEKYIKQVYECECGKRYDAFPALYLHIKRKHDIKISNNMPSKNCRVRTTNYCKVMTFLICGPEASDQEQKLVINENFKNKLDLIISDFQSKEINQKVQGAIFPIVRFKEYLSRNMKDKEGLAQWEFFQTMPNLFNEFFIQELCQGNLNSSNLQVWRQVFVCFSRWLKLKGYTQLEAIENEKFEIKQKQTISNN